MRGGELTIFRCPLQGRHVHMPKLAGTFWTIVTIDTVLQSKRVNFVSFYIKFYNLKPDAY